MTEPGGCTVASLAELRARPELLQPPTAILPRLAWKSRVVLLAGEPKGGKSTTLTAAAAVLSRGGYLFGDFVNVGRTLWLSSDGEALGDLVARFARFGAEPANIDVVTQWDGTPSAFLAKVYERRPELVVIDTLSTFSSLVVQDFNNAAQWVALLSQIKRTATETSAAFCLGHHVNKATGRYRDSSHLGAAVDAILEIQPAEDGTSIRKVRARARWSVEPFSFRLEGDELELVDATALTPDVRILLAVEEHPGATVAALREAVGIRAKDFHRLLTSLLDRGAIEDRGGERRRAFYRAGTTGTTGNDAGNDVRTTPDTAPENDRNSLRDISGTTGNDAGNDRAGTVRDAESAVVPSPLKGEGGNGRTDALAPCAVCGSEELSWLAGTWQCEACARAGERVAA